MGLVYKRGNQAAAVGQIGGGLESTGVFMEIFVPLILAGTGSSGKFANCHLVSPLVDLFLYLDGGL